VVRARAVAYLRRQQDGDGGFASQPGGGSNAQSTAWAIQGLEAAGVDPQAVRRHGARSPVAYLRSLIDPRGRVAYARGNPQTPVWVTGEALMALEGKPLPLIPPPAARPAPAASQSATSTTSATTAAPAIHRVRPARGHPATRHTVTPRRRPAAPTAQVRAAQTGRWAAAMGVLTALVLAPVDGG